ncbi:MAG: emopamil-binding family protein [Deltaproteobacteria bacterium]
MEARQGLPISQRKGDWFFVGVFAFFTWSSIFSDGFAALGLIGEGGFWSQANAWYAAMGDPFYGADHWWFRISPGISAFVYGPFYLVLVWAIIKGRNAVRLPALIYAGMMTHGMTEVLYWEFFNPLGQQPSNLAWFLGWNMPYLVFPILFAVRVYKPEPFGRA